MKLMLRWPISCSYEVLNVLSHNFTFYCFIAVNYNISWLASNDGLQIVIQKIAIKFHVIYCRYGR